MAKPRIFISSTFFDLRQIREDLERFIKELGYEPVRHETGQIPYGKEDPPENYAYKEIEMCDIIVTVIGGRYGSESQVEIGYSVTQNELKAALEKGVQVFIFIENNVLSEFSTYQINRENKKIKYKFVDNVKIYEFIDSLYQLKQNNPIASFQTAKDITDYLRNQWSGLFQRFLQEQKRISELNILSEMKSVANTLQQLVNFLTKERKSKDDAIQSILLSNHPAFREFANLTETKYRVYFTNKVELNTWLSARGWKLIDKNKWDDDSVLEWANDKKDEFLSLTKNIFDKDEKLVIFTEEQWKTGWLELRTPTAIVKDDDMPF